MYVQHTLNASLKFRVLQFNFWCVFRKLQQSEQWFADGTFRCVPSQFKQLYTIHGLWNGRVLPFVYILMTRKTRALYEACLENVVGIAIGQFSIELEVQILSVDFEEAAISAFRHVFGENIRIQACHFHLCKAVQRQVGHLGMLRRYRQDADLALRIRMLPALAYVPPAQVSRLFRLVAQDIQQDAGALVHYFKSTYVEGAPVRNGRPGRPLRAPPRYPPKMWNCSANFDDGMATTNNALEGWNRRFNSLVARAHPSIWRFLEKLKEEQEHTDAEAIRAEYGEPPKKKRRSVTQRANRLRSIIHNAAGVYDIQFLRSVAHNFAQ